MMNFFRLEHRDILGSSICYIIINTLPSLSLCQEQRDNKVHPALNHLGLEVTAITSVHISTREAGKYNVAHRYLVSLCQA